MKSSAAGAVRQATAVDRPYLAVGSFDDAQHLSAYLVVPPQPFVVRADDQVGRAGQYGGHGLRQTRPIL